jgi:hypothetical protein
MANRLKNRVNNLEGTKSIKLPGIIIIFDNPKYDDTGVMIEADCYLDRTCSSKKMNIDESEEYTRANGYTYVAYLPVETKMEDVEIIHINS